MSYEPNTTIPWGNLVNDINDQTDLKDKLNLKADKSSVQTDVPINAVFTDTLYDETNVNTHINNTNNPHNVTKTDVGLSLVDNTKDIDKPISNATAISITTKENALGRPNQDYKVLVGRIGTDIKEWKTLAEIDNLSDSGILTWGNINGILSDQTDLQELLDLKEELLENPFFDGQVLHSMTDGRKYWDFPEGSGGAAYDDSNVLKDADTVSPVTSSNKLMTQSDVASSGGGDMLKSVYDTNDNGIVDNAALVNSLTVETAVPAGALFTDTISSYDDTTIQAEVDLNTAKTGITTQQATDITTNNAKVSDVAHPIVNVEVPVGAVFTDTIYDDSTTLKDSDAFSEVTDINKLMTEDDIAALGLGDMLKSVYDTNDSGVVDDSELVNGLTVETAVPVGAVFTDTVYDDTGIQTEVDLNTAKVTNVDHPVVETAVPVGAVFTDTVYDDTSIQTDISTNSTAIMIKIDSNTSVASGSTQITNIISVTQSMYDELTPDTNTLYVIVG